MTAEEVEKMLERVEFQYWEVTPELAMDIIESQEDGDNYRNPAKSAVQKYAAMMMRGKWYTNISDPVVLYQPHRVDVRTQPRVLNGNHRIHAVFESGTTQTFFAIFLDESTIELYRDEAVDSGRTRSLGDYFSHHGVGNARVAGVARMLATQMQDSRKFESRCHYTKEELLDLAKAYKDGFEFVVLLVSGYKPGVTAGVLASCLRAFYCYPGRSAEIADFLDMYRDQTWTDPTGAHSSIRLLRQKYQQDVKVAGFQSQRSGALFSERAIEAYMEGKALKVLRPAHTPGQYLPLKKWTQR